MEGASRPKVLFFSAKPDERLLQRLGEVAEVVLPASPGLSPQEVIQRQAADVDVALGTVPWPAAAQALAPRLRLIATISVGFDHIDVPAATQRGILVTHTPDVLTDTTADTAFALLMMAGRRLGEAERFVRAGKWRSPGDATLLFGRDVHHATLGIVGLGRIGKAVARRAQGFGMKVIYYDIVRQEELEKQHGYQFVDFDTLLRESDFVTLHTNLTPETRHLMGAAQFAKMKPTAVLINASRGPVVDEQALIAALREGRIAAAGLDVFEKEPTDPDNPLLKMENVVVIPHIGSATAATRGAMADLAVSNVVAFLRGEPPLTPVNPEALAR